MNPMIGTSPALRRAEAAQSDDPGSLAELLCDESYFVRRTALANSRAPTDVIDLLVRAGASRDLRGTGVTDRTVSPGELERLAILGPFGRELVAAHPDAHGQVLARIASNGPHSARIAVLKHSRCPAAVLKAACVSLDAEERRLAAIHPQAPVELIKDLRDAGVDPELQNVRPPQQPLAVEAIERLASLGGCGRVVAAVQSNCPPGLLEVIALDDDWRVRLSVLQNRSTPAKALEHLLGIDDDQVRLRLLEHPNVPMGLLIEAASHPHLEVRIAAARHPDVPLESLRTLAADGAYQVREIVARHPRMPRDVIDRLRRLGSAEDLLNFEAPDPALAASEISALANLGLWPRRLAARHPNTNADTLRALACDADHVVREWAARHPNLPPDLLPLLERAGASRDLLGRTPPDTTLGPSELVSIAGLGPWAARLAAHHPNAPGSLLADFARSEDVALRSAAAAHANTPRESLGTLARDGTPEVRYAAASHTGVEDDTAACLAGDEIASIRLALIENPAVGDSIIAVLESDPNPDVAAAAKTRRATDLRQA